MKRITKIFKDLMTPDDQAQSWYGWASNQLSHAFLGAFIATFAGAYWLLTTLGFAALKETADLLRVFNVPAVVDSVTDILFWVGGAGIIAGGEYRWVFAVGVFVLLAAGVYVRVRNGKSRNS